MSEASAFPEPKKISVWAEGSSIEAKEYIIPKKNPDSGDEIPTIPDLDDLQDIIDKEISKAPVAAREETASALAEVGGLGAGGESAADAALDALRAHVPKVALDTSDSIWTVQSLMSQLADDENGSS